jgi:alpha-glucosidase
MAERIDATFFTPLHEVTAYDCIDGGIELTVDDAKFQVHVIRPDLIRFRAAFDEFVDNPTFAVSADLSSASAHFDVEHNAKSIRIETAALTVVIGRAPFRIDAYRKDGSPIFETAEVDGHPAALTHLNDEFLIARKIGKRDSILGLGEKTGAFNRRGRRYTLWNTDVLDPDASGQFMKGIDKTDPRRDPTSTVFDPYYMSIPFFYHVAENNAAAGFFVDNGFCGRFEFDGDDQYRFHFSGGQYTEYIVAGPAIRDILADYTWLTGRIPVPPLWALGYHQCRWHPYDHQKLGDLAGKFRKHEIPCDSLWLDIDYMTGYRVYTWNKKLFPNIEHTLEQMDDLGFRVITIVDPGVKYEPGYRIFDEGIDGGFFCKTEAGRIYTGQVWPGKTAFPDFVKAETREWWGKLTAEHIALGIAGIWNDMNEPATGRISPSTMRFVDGKYSHEAYHNQYALLMAMGTHDGMIAAEPNRRTFILSRAGFAGIQRYAANWMGDNMARWDHLKMSIPMAMGLGLSGQPFVGADIGGFAENSSEELLVRWMQYGVLTPFCRNHNNAGCHDQYPWTYGRKAEKLIRESIRLRYRLMPYLYSAFMEAVETGAPIQRPLAFDYQSDDAAAKVEDQYLFGSNLLVAPVCEPGIRSRSVYLPEGDWDHWFTGERYTGGKSIKAKTPKDYIPVFAKGGSVIPMWPEAPQSTMNYHPTAIELHLFVPEADGEYRSTLHEDDGATFAYRSGAHYRTEFTLTRKGDTLDLDASTTGHGYPEFSREEFVLVLHGIDPESNITVEAPGVTASMPIDNQVRIPNSGQSFRCTFRLG